MKTHRCETCNKLFATAATLRRHELSYYTEQSTKYQCWNCHKTYARKENVIQHSMKMHNDHEKKFVIITTINNRYRPNIFIPDPWTPPPEARQKQGTIYKINIPTLTPAPPVPKPTRNIPAITVTPPDPDWEPMTINEIDYRYTKRVTTEDLNDDLYLSSSDTSISSTDTVCYDEKLFHEDDPLDNIRRMISLYNTY